MQRRTLTSAVVVAAVTVALVAGAAGRADAGQTTRNPKGNTTIGAPRDPGVDPPYDPPTRPGDLSSPWRPPAGPGEITSPPEQPWNPPTGPGNVDNDIDRVDPVPDGCAGGKFMQYSHLQDKWLGSYGWSVHLFFYDKAAGTDQIGDAVVPIDENGEWLFCGWHGLPQQPKPFLYEYQSQNEWLTLNDTRLGESGAYRWNPFGATSPPQSGVYPTAPTTDFYPGLQLPTDKLDTGDLIDENGDHNVVHALVDVMRWATEALATLDAHDINPSPNSPHNMYYPDNQCGACFTNPSIRLDLEPSHITRFVVQHEIAHAVVAQYWAGSGVEFTGGEHELHSCITKTKLAYEEGIANFIAIWSHTPNWNEPTTAGDGIWSDMFSIESPSDVCGITTGEGSERWVAAALWDFHDHNVDGNDTVGSQDFAGVVKLILTHPVYDIWEFRTMYKAMQPDFVTWIDNVFNQNHINWV